MGSVGILWCLNRLYRHVANLGYVSSTSAGMGTVGILRCLNRLYRHVANLGYVSSTLSTLTMPEYFDTCLGYIDMLPSWAMSHRHCLLWQCQNTLMPASAISTCCHHGLCLIDIVYFDNAIILWCLLGLYQHVVIMGYVSSTLSTLTMLEYFDACLSCASTEHLLVC
jgi:hypothetical protein